MMLFGMVFVTLMIVESSLRSLVIGRSRVWHYCTMVWMPCLAILLLFPQASNWNIHQVLGLSPYSEKKF
ncbi:hypothetical protein BKA64DRAFT_662625 [Cadophora sp. MPI-SDFR-AT-0126]|nr:hypothetical protein BKA64DRAFT_662625 [Leotiomycetes sp. MPI-SDFR-AT-0126]